MFHRPIPDSGAVEAVDLSTVDPTNMVKGSKGAEIRDTLKTKQKTGGKKGRYVSTNHIFGDYPIFLA